MIDFDTLKPRAGANGAPPRAREISRGISRNATHDRRAIDALAVRRLDSRVFYPRTGKKIGSARLIEYASSRLLPDASKLSRRLRATNASRHFRNRGMPLGQWR